MEIRLTELGHIDHENPFVDAATPASQIGIIPAADGSDPNTMRKARYVSGAWVDDEAGLRAAEVSALQAQQSADAARDERDLRMAPLLAVRDRHRDELELGVATTLSDAEYQQTLAAIQHLRDVPQQIGFPDVIDWGGTVAP